uniref:Asator (inferred by orthology to a D. melanogaster protein) n=1 Tax=Strongyloides venezuelensis TaxID=75913 RepID=A0A0K0G2X5_STRVS
MTDRDKLVSYKISNVNNVKGKVKENSLKERTAYDGEGNKIIEAVPSETKNIHSIGADKLKNPPVEANVNDNPPKVVEKKNEEHKNTRTKNTSTVTKNSGKGEKKKEVNGGKCQKNTCNDESVENLDVDTNEKTFNGSKMKSPVVKNDNINAKKASKTKKCLDIVSRNIQKAKFSTSKCNPKDGPIDLAKETLINGRFQIKSKIGSGGCGSVYRCFDNVKNIHVALKAETNRSDSSNILKFEVKVLQNLDGRRNVVQLISFGKKESFSWIVMTLLGYNIYDLKKDCNSFTNSTIARIGIQILYGLKELHEAGFVHRDVKPQNMAIGGRITTMKIIHLLDFGLSREYVIINNAVPVVREQRSRVLFRGTSRYCSINAQKNNEQGRHDDLWSLLYVMAELTKPLPWSKLGRDKLQILKVKESTTTRSLFPNFPEMEIMSDYLGTLNYYSKPKYSTIFQILNYMLMSSKGHMSDLYDWEVKEIVKVPEEYVKATTKLNINNKVEATPTVTTKLNNSEKPDDTRKMEKEESVVVIIVDVQNPVVPQDLLLLMIRMLTTNRL